MKKSTSMYVQIVTAKTTLPFDEFIKIAKEREPQFAALPGLIQKYYIKTGEPDTYGGVYIWESKKAMLAYRESDLAATIGAAYQTTGVPNVQVADVLFKLRD